jgi:hypothetical protein
MFRCLFHLVAAATIAFPLSNAARGMDSLASFTLDLPFQANAATPDWLGHPQTPSGNVASLELPLSPEGSGASLLVTVFFVEQPEGFLRIIWNGPSGAKSLSDNFYEGIGMSNQRSLLIDGATLAGGGSLILQASGAELGVARIRFQWLDQRNSWVNPDIRESLVVASPDSTTTTSAVDGGPPTAQGSSWHGRLAYVALTDSPQRIEQGVEFSVQIDGPVLAGRLALKENGLPWGQRLVVWVNQQRAATITPALPSLTEEGFWSETNAAGVYVGWRPGFAYLASSLFKTGANTFQISVEPDTAGTESATAPASSSFPLALKDAFLQLVFPASETTETAPTTASSAPASSLNNQPTPAP